MKVTIQREGDNKRIKFAGKINMAQEIVLSEEDTKKLAEALTSEEDTSFDTE